MNHRLLSQNNQKFKRKSHTINFHLNLFENKFLINFANMQHVSQVESSFSQMDKLIIKINLNILK